MERDIITYFGAILRLMGKVSRKQTGINLVSNISYLIINIVIGIFLIPFYVDTLGVAAYGIIPLATSMIGYVGLFTGSLNSAVARFLTIDVQSSDSNKANITFNSAIFGVSKLILILVPVVLVLSFLAPSWFGVSIENKMDATWLFVGIGLAFLMRAWSSNFTVTLYARNRLDLINVINLINLVGQILLIVALFTVTTPSLSAIGFSYLFSSAIATAISIILYIKMNENLSIRYHYFDRLRFKEIAQMGGWNIIDNLGALLFLNVDLIIVNYLFGSTAGGEYAIALQWVTLLRSLVSTFISVLGPIILIAYATKQMENIVIISKSAVKMTSICMAVPVGFLCGFAPNILAVWVGEEFAHLAPLMILLVSHLVINTAVIPLFQIYTAYNKVRVPAILTLVGGVGNLVLAIFFASSLEWGVYGVAAAGLITLTLKNFFFTPIYASIVMGIPLRTFYPSIIPGVILMGLIALISASLSNLISLSNILGLVLLAGVITAGSVVFIWKFTLNDMERSLVPLPKITRKRHT